MCEYKVGYYVREGFFQDIVKIGNGNVLVYCNEAATRNEFNKFGGSWHLYAYFHETGEWHPLVKSKPVKKRIILREFTTPDGLVNSLLGYEFPVTAVPKDQGSGCEISKDGNISYRENCIFL